MGPPMAPALPSGFTKPTLLSKIVRPSVVLATLVLLLLCSVMGMGIGIARLKEDRDTPLPASIGACQGFMIVTSGFSVIYILIHLVCAIHNEPVGHARPPKKILHRCCFVAARVTLVLWMVCVITTAIVISRPGICAESSQECTLQMLDLIAACLCFLGSGLIMVNLEASKYPFEIPEAFTGVNCRVSDFGDDLFERNVSGISSFGFGSVGSMVLENTPAKDAPIENAVVENAVVENVVVESVDAPNRTVPGEYPLEHPLSSFLPQIPSHGGGTWTEEVKDLVGEKEPRKIDSQRVDSGIDMRSASTSRTNSSTSDSANPEYLKKSAQHPRVVSPSSSIIDESHRSPLCRMRSAEFPNVIFQSDLRVLPTGLPPPHDFVLFRAIPTARLPSKVNTHNAQRQQPKTTKIAQKKRPRITKTAPRTSEASASKSQQSGKAKTPHRRTTADIKVPGAYIDNFASLDSERRRKLEEHSRRIETHVSVRIQRTSGSETPRGVTKGQRPVPSDARSSRKRYSWQESVNSRPNSTTGGKGKMPSEERSVGAEEKTLRRINLVDNGPVPKGTLNTST